MKSIIIALFFSVFAYTANSQIDTATAAKNTQNAYFVKDKSGKPLFKSKDVPNGIPHLVLYNLAKNELDIKLSFDAQQWTDFRIPPASKNVYRCNEQRMFIIVNPADTNAVKAKIFRLKKYKIVYDPQLKIYDILEIP